MALRVPLAQTAGSAQAGSQGQPPSCPQAYEELHSEGKCPLSPPRRHPAPGPPTPGGPCAALVTGEQVGTSRTYQ